MIHPGDTTTVHPVQEWVNSAGSVPTPKAKVDIYYQGGCGDDTVDGGCASGTEIHINPSYDKSLEKTHYLQ